MTKSRGVAVAVLGFMLFALSASSGYAGSVQHLSHDIGNGELGQYRPVPNQDSGRAVADSTPRTSGIIIGPAPGHAVNGQSPDTGAGQKERSTATNGEERQIELAFWTSIRDSSDPADFEAYLDVYPDGVFARLAHNRLAALEAEAELVKADPASPDETSTAPDSRQLARLLQIELQRAGCNPGKADGQWGPRSRRALERFNRHAGTRLPIEAATAETLEAVRSRSTACPAVAQQPKRPAAPAAQQSAAQRPTAPAVQPSSAPRPSCTREQRRMGGGNRWVQAYYCSMD